MPEELLAAAPESPYFFDPELFTAAADEAVSRGEDTFSDAVAREALPSGGTVLDVGAGAGAASLRLAGGAARLVAVDASRELLDAFSARAGRMNVESLVIEGRWPDIAAAAPIADVVVCHHVVYNVADLGAFAAALTTHAARRVVVELTTQHPMAWMAPYWEAMHGLRQPDGPTVEDAVEVLTAMGVEVAQRRWSRRVQMIGEADRDMTAKIARRLCLSADRHAALSQLLDEVPPPAEREVATLWWAPG